MKKKLLKTFKREAQEEAAPVRITNDTVAEHRERILAGGRRFKYPVQYAKHKLVFNTILIVAVTLAAIILIGWWQLYQAQTTSEFFYRTTKIIPVPVASVDGAAVPYSDYLMRYRSQEHWLDHNGQIERSEKDRHRQLSYIKRSVLDALLMDTFAAKLAREKQITVSDKEVDEVVARSLETANGTISQELYDASTLETLGYDREEYRLLIRQSLLRQKVAYNLDDAAKMIAIKAEALIRKSPDIAFASVVKKLGAGVERGLSGPVRKTSQDGGLTEEASKLNPGQTSGVVESTSGDGYYLVRLISSTDTDLTYEYIRVPLTVFNEEFAKVKKAGKIQEYIKIDNK